MSVAQMNLLIVEDDPSLRSSFDLIFSAIGYRVRTARDGFAALEAIREQVPDILLSDLKMPRMSGWELLSVVSRRFPQLRAVAMSGAFSGDAIPRGVSADAFYEKGTGMSALLSAVDKSSVRRRAPASHPDPIWIQKSGQNALSEESVTIACPECFRTFSQSVGNTVNMFFDTNCVHCGGLISYAMVEPIDSFKKPAALRN